MTDDLGGFSFPEEIQQAVKDCFKDGDIITRTEKNEDPSLDNWVVTFEQDLSGMVAFRLPDGESFAVPGKLIKILAEYCLKDRLVGMPKTLYGFPVHKLGHFYEVDHGNGIIVMGEPIRFMSLEDAFPRITFED